MGLKVQSSLNKIVIFTLWILFPFVSFAQCAGIDFTASETSVCAPKLVRFYAQNIPAGSTITWDYGFGDNLGKDTGQNIYTTTGTYTIVLKVTLSDGVTTCTVSKPNYVTVYDPPTPSFTVSRKVLCSGADTITITDNSVGGIGRDWVIDGLPVSDTSKTIIHSFNSTGYKDILLVLKSSNCATTYYRVDSAVRIYNPLTFDFTADKTVGCAPASINFTPTISSTGHTIASYDWTFTGGTPATSNSTNPIVTYNSSGSFSASLTITNTDGCSETVSKNNYLQMGDTNNFSVIPSKTSGCRNEEVNLAISDPSLQGNFTWDLGNGVPQAGSTPKNQIVQFNDTGYQYYKVVREYNGCITERAYFTAVYMRPPLANFTVLNEVECDPNARVYVFNTSKVDPTATHTYRWNLYGTNGSLINTSTDSIPVFSTNGFGNYGLELIVTSSAGCVDTLRQDNIYRRTGVGNFFIQPEASCVGGNVSFISNSAAFSTAEPNIYYWTIFDTDGTTVLYTENSGILPSINYSFSKSGSYNVNLVVYNSKCRDTVKVNKAVDIVSPATTIVASDRFPCVKTPINLTASSAPAIAAPGYRYTWILQNSNQPEISFTSTGASAALLPDTGGVYDLLTVIEWGVGCRDTVKQNGYIQVSGPAFTISNTNYSDCLPLVTNAASNIVHNHNYKTPGNTNISYSWSSIPIGAVFANAGAANTQVTFNNNGEYYLRLIATNGSGCVDTVDDPLPIYAGVVSDFELSKDIVCTREEISVTPQSLYQPDRYQWISYPPGAVFSPSADVASPTIVFPDSGIYLLAMVASKRNTCFDTLYTVVDVTETIADFYSEDTLNYCAPVSVTFQSTAINADTLIWSFGDGKTLRTPDVDSLTYIYFNNSTPPGFTIKLKAINALGCSDSITRFGYIRIDGPVPDYSIDVTKGCEPLSVTITDKSLSYSEYYFDYGDGSAFDTTGNPGTHIYTTDNTTDEISRFKPSLFLLDPLGCFSENKFPFDIEVYKQPIIKFRTDTTVGCVPLQVQVIDSSKFVREYQWDLNGDGAVDDTARNPIYTYGASGLFTPRLRARSQYGCINSDSILDYVRVYPLPNAAFTYTKIEGDTLNVFYDLINQSTNFNALEWYIDSQFVETMPIFRYPFQDTGAVNVKLIAISADGCKDSVDTLLYIVPDYFFHIPNAFTPNGRGGNEKFGPYAPIWAKEYKMRIFNRYGEMLFETERFEDQWDGTFRDVPVQQDVYLYSIEYMDLHSVWHVFHGTVLLIR